MTTTTPDKPKHRWHRYGLRSLFLLIVVVAVLLGWTIYKVRQKGKAVAALEEMSCKISYDIGEESSPTILERLRTLLGEEETRDVTGVIGNGSQITDAGMANLRGLRRSQI